MFTFLSLQSAVCRISVQALSNAGVRQAKSSASIRLPTEALLPSLLSRLPAQQFGGPCDSVTAAGLRKRHLSFLRLHVSQHHNGDTDIYSASRDRYGEDLGIFRTCQNAP